MHPHQRCGYSDSPFARKHTFLYWRVQEWVGEGSRRWAGTQKGSCIRPSPTHKDVVMNFRAWEMNFLDATPHRTMPGDLLSRICLWHDAKFVFLHPMGSLLEWLFKQAFRRVIHFTSLIALAAGAASLGRLHQQPTP